MTSALRPWQAIVLHESDTVATALVELHHQDSALISNGDLVEVVQDIPFGYKFALCAIARGDTVIKYGVPIGFAIQAIRPGELVHTHNLESLQGIGDQK
ncbi:MAG: UxaA family hydrolase [Firmicutes bacterium]|nr:UxaA family hydrolase [Bacillota bacterium]